MLTPVGVKVLDFGLARAFETETESPPDPSSRSATTATRPLTREGEAVGTLPYMAPEQLQGGSVDARCDIFALGAILFEAATGRRAFDGKSSSAIARGILTTDPPPVSTLAPGSPRSLECIIQLCLEKEPEPRFRSAHDVGLQLPLFREEYPVARPSWTRYALSGASFLVGAIVLGIFMRVPRRDVTAGVEVPVRFELFPPAGGGFLSHVEGSPLAVSPDGSLIAFIASSPGSPPRVWVRAMDQIEARPVAGTEEADSILWSRDGRSIGFFAGGSLRRVELSGAAPVTIVELSPGIGRMGTWGATSIVFSSIQGEAIYRVSPDGDGGEPEVVLRPDASRGEQRTSWPWFLPDGRSFLYWLKLADGEGQLMLARPGKAPKEVASGVQSQAHYVGPGVLVYARESVLLAQRFDASEGTTRGPPFPVAPVVRYFLSTGFAAFASSATGTLVSRSETDVMRLSWFDRTGKNLGSVGAPGEFLNLAISPDGRRALFDRVRPGLGTWDIWSLDIDRGIETRVTSGRDTEGGARFFPDGKHIVYYAAQGGAPQMVYRDLEEERDELLLPAPGFQQPLDVSPNGRSLLFAERNAGRFIMSTLSLDGDEKRAAVPLEGAAPGIMPYRLGQGGARFSPDGRWVAYVSNESGSYEAYVVRSSGRGERMQVSSGGATTVRWGRGGSELVYLTADGSMFSAPVATGSELQLEKAALLFRLPEGSLWRSFELMPEGDRFLAIVMESSGDERPATVVLNVKNLMAP